MASLDLPLSAFYRNAGLQVSSSTLSRTFYFEGTKLSTVFIMVV